MKSAQTDKHGVAAETCSKVTQYVIRKAWSRKFHTPKSEAIS